MLSLTVFLRDSSQNKQLLIMLYVHVRCLEQEVIWYSVNATAKRTHFDPAQCKRSLKLVFFKKTESGFRNTNENVGAEL